MEYTPLHDIPHYSNCEPLVTGLGYALIELRIGHTQNKYQVRLAIAHLNDPNQGVGINDCAKVHRLLLPRLEALFQSPEVYMEVTSPGTDRHIKNAAEFPFFKGRKVRLWTTELKDWEHGTIVSADAKSITIETEGGNRSIPFENISKAKLLNT